MKADVQYVLPLAKIMEKVSFFNLTEDSLNQVLRCSSKCVEETLTLDQEVFGIGMLDGGPTKRYFIVHRFSHLV
jgi:hypothetical protein